MSLLPPLPSNPVFSTFYISLLPPLQLTCYSNAKVQSSPSLSMVSVPLGDKILLCDSSTGLLHPLVPVQLCCQLLNLLQAASYPGIRASQRLISSKFVWPRLSQEMGLWAWSFLWCQQSKVQTHVRSSVPAIPVPTWRFSHIHIDIVGPLRLVKVSPTFSL